jgi:hypothetical protein
VKETIDFFVTKKDGFPCKDQHHYQYNTLQEKCRPYMYKGSLKHGTSIKYGLHESLSTTQGRQLPETTH